MSDIQSYVTASKVKEKVKAAGLRLSGDATEALNAKVDAHIGEAIARAEANGRATVKPQDF